MFSVDSIGDGVNTSHSESEWKKPTTMRKEKRILDKLNGYSKFEHEINGDVEDDEVQKNKKQKISTKTISKNGEIQNINAISIVTQQEHDVSKNSIAKNGEELSSSSWMITSTLKNIAEGKYYYCAFTSNTNN